MGGRNSLAPLCLWCLAVLQPLVAVQGESCPADGLPTLFQAYTVCLEDNTNCYCLLPMISQIELWGCTGDPDAAPYVLTYKSVCEGGGTTTTTPALVTTATTAAAPTSDPLCRLWFNSLLSCVKEADKLAKGQRDAELCRCYQEFKNNVLPNNVDKHNCLPDLGMTPADVEKDVRQYCKGQTTYAPVTTQVVTTTTVPCDRDELDGIVRDINNCTMGLPDLGWGNYSETCDCLSPYTQALNNASCAGEYQRLHDLRVVCHINGTVTTPQPHSTELPCPTASPFNGHGKHSYPLTTVALVGALSFLGGIAAASCMCCCCCRRSKTKSGNGSHPAVPYAPLAASGDPSVQQPSATPQTASKPPSSRQTNDPPMLPF